MLPAPHDALLPHRLPQPPRCHVREPIGSLVHGEAGGRAPRLHRHPGERPAAPERGGEPSERPGLSIPSHRLRPGPALGSAGGPSGGQPGGSAQLAGRCPSATPAPRRVLPADATLGGPHWAPRQAGRPRADSASCSRRRRQVGADAGQGARVLDAALPLRGARACHVPSGVTRSSAATAATVPHGHPSPPAPCQESTRTPLLARCLAAQADFASQGGRRPGWAPVCCSRPRLEGQQLRAAGFPRGSHGGCQGPADSGQRRAVGWRRRSQPHGLRGARGPGRGFVGGAVQGSGTCERMERIGAAAGPVGEAARRARVIAVR